MILASISETVAGTVLDGPVLVAVILAAAAGALSFFSPCCLPLVPGYLAYLTGAAGPRRDSPGEDTVAVIRPVEVGIGAGGGGTARPVGNVTRGPRAPGGTGYLVAASSLFVLGFSAVFTSYGTLFGSLGALLVTHQELLARVLGVLTIVMGLVFAGALRRVPLAGVTFRIHYRPRTGLVGAPLVGALFGVGWTPCMGPTLAAVLSLATTTGTAGRGAVLSLAYSLGLGIPFVLAAAGFGRGLRRFGWARSHGHRVTQIGGAFLVLLGLLQLSGTWTAALSALRGTITGYTVPL